MDDRGVVRHDAIHAERWTLKGTAKVTGEADAGAIDLHGTAVIGAGLTADSVETVGTLDVGGPIRVRSRLRVEGHLRSRGTVEAGAVELRGATRLSADLRIERTLRARGTLAAPNLRAAEIDLAGAVEVPGALEAERVDARFERDSHLGRIQARSVRLRGRVPSVVDRAFFRHATVAVERIDADRVELEAVSVTFVRSPEIVVGRDASVAGFEGKIVERHPSSRVGPESRTPPPYGLRR